MWFLSSTWLVLPCVLSGLFFSFFLVLFFWSSKKRGLPFRQLLIIIFAQGIKTAINALSAVQIPKSKHSILCTDLSKPCINLSSCPTAYSAAVFRIYKKTSAAVCERPRGPELWTISSIVFAPRSPTVWQRNNRCPNVGFLMRHGDVSVGPEPLLGFLIFNYDIFCCDQILGFGLYADPLRENKSFGFLVTNQKNRCHGCLPKSRMWK